jgi:hypothetical protein
MFDYPVDWRIAFKKGPKVVDFATTNRLSVNVGDYHAYYYCLRNPRNSVRQHP